METQNPQDKNLDAPPTPSTPSPHLQESNVREKMYEEIRHKHEQEDQKAKESGHRMAFWAMIALVFVLGVALLDQRGIFGSPELGKPIPYTPTDQAIYGVEKELAPRVMSQSAEEKETREAQQMAHIKQMETEIGSLTEIVKSLQGRVTAIDEKEGSERKKIESSLGGIMALTRLETHMARGVPYEADLAILRQVLADSSSLLAALSALEPFATTGVETFDVLKNSFAEKAKQQELLLQKSEATTWYARLVLALRGFVTIRGVGDDPAKELGRYAPVFEALTRNDHGAVLAAFDALPEAAQAPFSVWRTKLQARIEMRKVLDRVAEKLIGAGADTLLKTPKSSQETTSTPSDPARSP